MDDSSAYRHEDVGNVMALEHVNVGIPDQATATLFYVVGLGLTRDPHWNVGLDNMWINVGAQQFHLPTREPQVIRGHVGLVFPGLEALQRRLERVQDKLQGTQFGWRALGDEVEVTSPWGNRLRCFAPDQRFGDMALGIPYVEFLVPPGTAEGIGQFYARAIGAPAAVETDQTGPFARVHIGRNQHLVFRETHEQLAPYDGHHVAVYLANFSGPYSFLARRGLITEDVRNHQFRFQEIVDPETEEPLFTLEHEVRSLRHAMYSRVLVNRTAD